MTPAEWAAVAGTIATIIGLGPQIAKRHAEKADQRVARLRATFRREPRGDSYGDWLIIHNHGPATALRVRIQARPLNAAEQARAAAAIGILPSPDRIAPGGTVRHRLGTFDGVPDAYQVELTWTHEDNSSGEWGAPVHRE